MMYLLTEGVSCLQRSNRKKIDNKKEPDYRQQDDELHEQSYNINNTQAEVAVLVSSILNPERND